MHLAVGTPMYGGQCCSEYTSSMLALKGSMEKYNHEMTGIFVGNESLIQRARNKIVHIFLNTTNASHLLFMDADQSFDPSDIVKLIKADKGIIAGIVPMKGINWDRIREACRMNKTQLVQATGMLDPQLKHLTGIFNIQHLPEMIVDEENIHKPFQVKYAGTGYMLIKREVFEDLAPHVGIYNDRGAKIHNFFSAEIVGEELLSEDFHFCHLYREKGGEVWAAPWTKVGHFGSYHFEGSYAECSAFDKVATEAAIVNGSVA